MLKFGLNKFVQCKLSSHLWCGCPRLRNGEKNIPARDPKQCGGVGGECSIILLMLMMMMRMMMMMIDDGDDDDDGVQAVQDVDGDDIVVVVDDEN